jgi:CheY-like chemotaxis protein
VLLSVVDSGEGMDEATRTHLFEPFFTTKPPGEGTGLGLPTVYGIVQQGGGHIVVESSPGAGAAFHIYLPPEQGTPAVARREPVPAGAGSARVLVVDDEATIRSLVRRILEKHGYEVREAKSGNDALWRAGEDPDPVDLLLTDVVMPGMDGRELARRFSAVRPDTRILLMTGYSERARDPGGAAPPTFDPYAVVEKPFTAGQLLAAVERALRDREER